MEHEKVPAVNVKEYKKQGKTEAAAYLKRRNKSKSVAEFLSTVKERRQNVRQWKKSLKDLEKKERKAQKKGYKAYKKRLHRTRTIAVWAAVLLVVVMVLNSAAPMIHNIGAILSQKYTDQTADAQAARAAGEAFATDISEKRK